MNDYDYLETVVGCSCTLLIAYKGYTEGTVVEDFGLRGCRQAHKWQGRGGVQGRRAYLRLTDED